tara:strand:- start:573 stop:1100 length:528 start_codon:yes stop_codon:yes gene_type:complete
MNGIIEKAKENFNKTFDKLNKAGGVLLIYDANNVHKDNFKPILITNSEEQMKKKINKKVSNNPDKYKKVRFVRITILGNIDDIGEVNFTMGIGSAFSVDVAFYSLNSFNKITISENDAYARFWYTDNILAEKGFSISHVKKAIKILQKGVLISNPFKVYYIDKLSEYAKLKKIKK